MKNWHYILLLTFIALVFSCKDENKDKQDDTLYTCSMHPQIVQDEPGTCPICHMELTPMKAGDKEQQGLMLTETQQLLANVQADTVRIQPFGEEIVFTASAVANPGQVERISSRVGGRIEKLYVRNPGEKIRAGQLLYDIYSEELITTIKEYLLTSRSDTTKGLAERFKQMSGAARNKLLLWGITEGQLKSFKSNPVTERVPIYSMVSGIVADILIREGEYVMEGSPVFEVTNLNTLWVDVLAYPNETRYFDPGSEVEVLFSGANERVKGKVVAFNPALQPQTQLNIVRVSIDNPRQLYRPGMQAYVYIQTQARQVITVPADAILHDTRGSMVWIRNPEGYFERRMVTAGIRSGNRVEIVSGLKQGEIVVVSGAYLLNSEFILRKGSDPHAGMDM